VTAEERREAAQIHRRELIGPRHATGGRDETVSGYMKPHHELSADVSLFAAIGVIVGHYYVLMRIAQERRFINLSYLRLGDSPCQITGILGRTLLFANNAQNAARFYVFIFVVHFGLYQPTPSR
jgi:hypothetical protein